MAWVEWNVPLKQRRENRKEMQENAIISLLKKNFEFTCFPVKPWQMTLVLLEIDKFLYVASYGSLKTHWLLPKEELKSFLFTKEKA